MRIIKHYSDYISIKKDYQDVISWAEYVGIELLSHVDVTTLYVIRFNKNDYDYYRYAYQNQTFKITNLKEHIQHPLNTIFPDEMLSDTKTIRWWNQVFFESGKEEYTFDPYYRNLKVADNANKIFNNLIDELAALIKEWDISPKITIYLNGDFCNCIPLLYVLQLSKNCKVRILPQIRALQNNIIMEKHLVKPDNLLNFHIETQKRIRLSEITGRKKIFITLPLYDNILSSRAIEKFTWKDLLQNENPDYTVCDKPFKRLKLSTDTDCFQNIFLHIQDSTKHYKRVLVYSPIVSDTKEEKR